jgi:Ca2+-binding EF-hand superfamily protein
MFNNMDTDKSGSITLDELKTGLSRLGSKVTEIEIKQLMDAVSSVNLSHYPVITLHTETNKLFIVIYI